MSQKDQDSPSESENEPIPISQYPPYKSPICSYFNTSQSYLTRKYSESSGLNYEKSNNYIRKDSLLQNQNLENEYEGLKVNNEEDDDDYNELTPDANYYQQPVNSFSPPITEMPNVNIPNINLNINSNFIIGQRPRFNSINAFGVNFLNLFHKNTSNSNQYTTEMYGRKGWICSLCNNFNYSTRNKCNKCSASKSPKKIKKRKGTNENEDTKSSSKQFSERVGDWICFKCKNLNFAFRSVCNRCQIPKEESEKLTKQSYSTISNNGKDDS